MRSRRARKSFGGVQSLQINDARAFYQGQQQIRHLRQHVKHRQHAQHCVRRPNVDPIEHRFHFAEKVGVGKHYALGIGGGARGVEQGSEIVRGCGRRLEFSWPAIENRRQICQPALGGRVLDHAVRVHQHEPDVEVRNRVTRRLRMLRVAEQG